MTSRDQNHSADTDISDLQLILECTDIAEAFARFQAITRELERSERSTSLDQMCLLVGNSTASSNYLVRARALQLLGRVDHQRVAGVLPSILRVENDPSQFVRETFCYCLGNFIQQTSDATLKDICSSRLINLALTDSRPPVRTAAGLNLQHSSLDKMEEVVAHALTCMELPTRLRVLDLLRVNPSLARLHLSALKDNLNNSHRKVRQKAVAACEHLTEPTLVPLVVRRLFEHDTRISAAALRVIESYCQNDQEFQGPQVEYLRTIKVHSTEPGLCMQALLELCALNELPVEANGSPGSNFCTPEAHDSKRKQLTKGIYELVQARFGQ